jgi:hypothetical protein
MNGIGKHDANLDNACNPSSMGDIVLLFGYFPNDPVSGEIAWPAAGDHREGLEGVDEAL